MQLGKILCMQKWGKLAKSPQRSSVSTLKRSSKTFARVKVPWEKDLWRKKSGPKQRLKLTRAAILVLPGPRPPRSHQHALVLGVAYEAGPRYAPDPQGEIISCEKL